MKLKDLKIGTQIQLAFGLILFFVLLLGLISFQQSNRINQQTKTMFEHPVQVRRALNLLTGDIIGIHRDMKDLFITEPSEFVSDLNRIELLKQDAFTQIEILYENYLGPKTDIDSLKQSFIIWNAMREETIRLMREGKLDEAAKRTKSTGVAGKQVDLTLMYLQRISDFAHNKANELYSNSKAIYQRLTLNLAIVVLAVILLLILIFYFLMKNIRTPLVGLTDVTRRFHGGNLDSRSSYVSESEVGILSKSFNSLAGNIQQDLELNEKVTTLAGHLLSEYDSGKFFTIMLQTLSEHTGAQMSAVYLLSDDKRRFVCAGSLGFDGKVKDSFSATDFEGEFGVAFSSKSVSVIKNIPEDSRFVFPTTGVQFLPREIITIPLITKEEVAGIVTLATITKFRKQTLHYLERINEVLSARVEGVVAADKIEILAKKLGLQNAELEAQKMELASQSTELEEQNAELEAQKKQLEDASRLKTSFLSNMSHELRTPLNSVIALSGVLSRRLASKISGEESEFLEVIERNGKHLLSLINDIIDISRIESGYEEIEVSTFNANSLVSEMVAIIRPQATKKKIELTHLNSEMVVEITTDADKLRHIVQNLVGNAVKFTEEGSVVAEVATDPESIKITVSDTGIGIPGKHLPHIFDEFRQVDSSTSRKFGGTGLGLAIAKKYANLLGGSISVTSQVGQGSVFTLILPKKYNPQLKMDKGFDPVAETIKPQIRIKTGERSEPVSILLVDDSQPAIIQLQDILEETGFRILVANDGMEALETVKLATPDAIILDLMMPGMDGFEVLRLLREDETTSLVPVLILTAKQITKEELSFLKKNNVHQLIQKGDVNRIELIRAIRSLVEADDIKNREAQAPYENPALKQTEGKPTILVVEDNPDNLLTAKAILSDNYTIVEATNGQEGVEQALAHMPDLILMDIHLPVMDGIEAFKAIRKIPELQHVPIIALTASTLTSDREAILAYGFDAFVPKPMDEKSLLKTIKSAIYGK